MNTSLLTTEKDYFDYCAVEGIGSISRRYGSQWCDIENGDATDHWEQFGSESLHITQKPTHYPCIIAWHQIGGDHEDVYGSFIYPENFNEE